MRKRGRGSVKKVEYLRRTDVPVERDSLSHKQDSILRDTNTFPGSPLCEVSNITARYCGDSVYLLSKKSNH